MLARAEELMRLINRAILSGKNSDDSDVAPLVREFKALLRKGANPPDYDNTEKWIGLSGKPPAKKASAKRAGAKKAPAKRAAKKAPTKRAVKKTAARAAR